MPAALELKCSGTEIDRWYSASSLGGPLYFHFLLGNPSGDLWTSVLWVIRSLLNESSL